jgi:Domain of Unknown Function (DUF1206)
VSTVNSVRTERASLSVEQAGESVRDAVDSAPVRALGRLGLTAYGVVHLLVAWLAIQVALGGGETADKSGALKTLASGVGGQILLWVIAIGLAGLVVWQLGEAAWGHRYVRSARRRLLQRAVNLGEAGLFGLLAFTAGSIAAGGAGVSDTDQRSTTAVMLSLPGGQFLVGVIGITIVGIAGYLVYRGISKAFLREMDLSSADPRAAQVAIRLGQVGWPALGVAYGTAGVLVVLAAVQFDPQEATGLDRALKTLAGQPYGVVLLLIVAAGVACFGAYCLFDARYRRA